MKKNKYIGIAMMAAGMLAATSCSDFSDYNEVPVDAAASGNKTLWENISENPQLSDFAALVTRAGFQQELLNARSYTVWAPVNGSFNVSAYDGLSADDLLQQFVKSHVAEYSHNATGYLNERVHTLNEKSFTFAGDGSYTYDGVTVSLPNQPSNNGIMHLIDGAAQYYPNLYEYLRMADDIDSLRNYFLRYELTTLDQDASVKGPMVDGVQTYIDSVMVTSNSLLRTLNAKIENEDSSYTFLMPTNTAYLDLYKTVKKKFNFITKTTVLDATNLSSATATTSKSVSVDPAYMSDSLSRMAIARHLIFSNNDGYNMWLTGTPSYLGSDTLRTTTRSKLSNPTELLAQTRGEAVKMSNGAARIVDSLAFRPWEVYCPEIDAYISNYLGSYFTAYIHNVHATNMDYVFGPELEDFRFLWIEPSGPYAKPDFYLTLPNVQSTTYKFYAVFLPAARMANDTLPNKLNFSLSYCAANGNLATYNFSAQEGDNNPKTLNMNTAYENNPYVTDTLYLGEFTFPVCYRGLGNDYFPSIHVTSPINVFNKTQMASYTRDVRMWAIIMKPVELVEFEEKNK